jgi:hypothetical protein
MKSSSVFNVSLLVVGLSLAACTQPVSAGSTTSQAATGDASSDEAFIESVLEDVGTRRS